ncbi:MAG: hypothetical protein AAFR78_05900 [Planctomycetota bacterium]
MHEEEPTPESEVEPTNSAPDQPGASSDSESEEASALSPEETLRAELAEDI